MDSRESSSRRAGPPGLPGLAAWQIGRAVWRESSQDNLALIAAGMAFYIFLALVPLLMAIVLTYGLVASPAEVADHIAILSARMPEEAAAILANQLRTIEETTRSTAGPGLVLTLLISIYGAMKAARGMITALNIVSGVKETRSFIRVKALTLAITLGLVLALILASLGISVVNFLAALVGDLGPLAIVVQAGYWLFAGLLINLLIDAVYRFAPARPGRRWRWVTPGSLLATMVWIVGTFAFSFFVRNFGNYNVTYGSLAAVIVFLTWLYLTAYIILMGAELNHVLEQRAASRGDRAGEGSIRAQSP